MHQQIFHNLPIENNVISGMDGWERWMYNESTGSLFILIIVHLTML